MKSQATQTEQAQQPRDMMGKSLPQLDFCAISDDRVSI